jgi:subtilisin family serine protease
LQTILAKRILILMLTVDVSSATTARGAIEDSLALVRLPALMDQSTGDKAVAIGLLDGPVAVAHPDLTEARTYPVGAWASVACRRGASPACQHGTLMAGVLVARRGSRAPAICPACPLLIRPIFAESAEYGGVPIARPEHVGHAIVECVRAGARVLNLSAATAEPSTLPDHQLHQALDYAARQGALVVAAAGNGSTLGTSVITRHPWVIPVAAYDWMGRPMNDSTLGASIGTRGVGGPGEEIESLGSGGLPRTGGGTSVAAGFVTGAIGLLWSLVPAATAAEVRRAVTQGGPRRAIAPPLLDAEQALRWLRTNARG